MPTEDCTSFGFRRGQGPALLGLRYEPGLVGDIRLR